jgi:hypothetical protein
MASSLEHGAGVVTTVSMTVAVWSPVMAGSVCWLLMQVQAEVQGAWKALRALCWCDDELARLASRHWLQQLLAVTLQQSLKVGSPLGAP